jgi:hypothetical protein
MVQEAAPPTLTQADVSRKLGFEFALPEGSQVAIYGATVSLVTTMPLTAAREYTARALRDAGFVLQETVERSPGEFYSDFTQGDRTLGVLVFQVTERGATIQLGAPK